MASFQRVSFDNLPHFAISQENDVHIFRKKYSLFLKLKNFNEIPMFKTINPYENKTIQSLLS